ncbi:TPA: hypothetical protein ACQTYG_001735 [Pseudomonas aeruginosa]|nr:hypothetical protein [Pseudomonas aeruginosa]
MSKIGPHMAAAGLVLATSCLATAGERPFTRNVQDLKQGQCVYASYVYEQGELLKMGESTTMVCTKVDGRSLWLAVDPKSLKEMGG